MGCPRKFPVPACIVIIEGKIGCFIHQFAPPVVHAERERARLTLTVYQQQVIYIIAVGEKAVGTCTFLGTIT
jgi:hypothetical protein